MKTTPTKKEKEIQQWVDENLKLIDNNPFLPNSVSIFTNTKPKIYYKEAVLNLAAIMLYNLKHHE
jgi:hypothetical protein